MCCFDYRYTFYIKDISIECDATDFVSLRLKKEMNYSLNSACRLPDSTSHMDHC